MKGHETNADPVSDEVHAGDDGYNSAISKRGFPGSGLVE